MKDNFYAFYINVIICKYVLFLFFSPIIKEVILRDTRKQKRVEKKYGKRNELKG
jgi:hypothetical protein